MDVNNLGEPTTKTSYENVCHLSKKLSEETSFLMSIHKAKGLHSLLIDIIDPSPRVTLLDVFKQLTCIRSLNLSGTSI